MKPIGLNSKDFGCCPGHDKVPYKDQYKTKTGKRDRIIRRKKELTRYWKRAFKTKNNFNEYES